MCTNPVTLRQSKQEVLEKTGEVLSFDRAFSVPCGSCIECLEKRRMAWTFRLKQELMVSTYAYFVTMTFDDDHLMRLDKKFLSDYFKRVRNAQKSVKYYAVAEYGSKNHRPHYHAIVFNVHADILIEKWRTDNRRVDSSSIGKLYFGDVTEASIHYVTGYLVNKDKQKFTADDIKPFALMSKGLGKSYLKHAKKFCKSNFTKVVNVEDGRKVLLPRYYTDRIFEKWELTNLGSIAYDDYLKSIEGYTRLELEEQQKSKEINVKSRIKRRKL